MDCAVQREIERHSLNYCLISSRFLLLKIVTLKYSNRSPYVVYDISVNCWRIGRKNSSALLVVA